MRSELLSTYLNDHLAGSVAALELVDHLVKITKGTDREGFFLTLGRDIQEDQHALSQLLGGVGGKESKARKAAAWLTEKIGEAKLRLDDPGDGTLRLLEALETLELGIQGKLALWRGLEEVADRVPELRSVDFPRLQRRAEDQIQQVEAQRMQVARMAFEPDDVRTAAPTR
jgi:hypothetical protein